MKKSLCLLVMCLGLNIPGAFAQDDDVYFVPSSKDKVEKSENEGAGRSSYHSVTDDERFAESHWAEGRGNGEWDVDSYNRRGKKYKGTSADTARSSRSSYDEGYADGYEDGYFTSRIVRFRSPRPGIYVSSPYYLDYYDLCYYDPWYYGYASSWSLSWSGWYGWGSWYGWRPYYSSWYWGWGNWYDPWWGPSYAWYPHYHWHSTHWYPANAERGPLGGYIAYSGRRGSSGTRYAGRQFGSSNRPSASFGTGRGNRYDATSGFTGRRPSRNFGLSDRPSRKYGNQRRPSTDRNDNSNRCNSHTRPSRSFKTSERSFQRSNYSQPSRSNFNRGGGSGVGRSFGGGGGRSGRGR